MRFFAPLLFLTSGASILALNAYRASSRFRERLSDEKLTGVQKAYEGRFLPILMICSGLYCTYGAIRTLIGAVNTWWLWFLAAAAYFGTVPMIRFVGAKLGAVEVRPDGETQRRRRRVLWFAAPAALCLFAARPAAESAVRLDNGVILVGSIVLMVAALAGFTAAGWAAVWASEASSSPLTPRT